MRYTTGLVLALSLGAAAAVAAPSAKAAGVYVGVGLPAPVYAAPVAACVPFAPGYYGPAAFCGAGWYAGRYWGGPYGYWGHGYGYGYGHGYGYGYGYGHGYARAGYGGYRGGGGHRR